MASLHFLKKILLIKLKQTEGFLFAGAVTSSIRALVLPADALSRSGLHLLKGAVLTASGKDHLSSQHQGCVYVALTLPYASTLPVFPA